MATETAVSMPGARFSAATLAIAFVTGARPLLSQVMPQPQSDDVGLESGLHADPWSSRPTTINGGGASGGPLGIVGASIEHAPTRWFVLGGGAGYQPGGATLAVWPRVRLPIGPVAFGIGVPLSIGPYRWTGSWVPDAGCSSSDCPYSVTRQWSVAAWMHLEPSIELRLQQGMVVRFFAGRSQVLDPSDGACESAMHSACPSSGGEKVWYGGITAGYAF